MAREEEFYQPPYSLPGSRSPTTPDSGEWVDGGADGEPVMAIGGTPLRQGGPLTPIDDSRHLGSQTARASEGTQPQG